MTTTADLASRLVRQVKGKVGMAKDWISSAIKHPGALHRQMGIPQGKKIPAGKLASAAKSGDPLLARRARLAQTLRSMQRAK